LKVARDTINKKMRTSIRNRERKDAASEATQTTDAEAEEDAAVIGDAKFAPDHLFFDESFTPVVEKVLGRKVIQNEKDEPEELYLIKVLFSLFDLVVS
jgi:hypothetical protein